MENKSELYQKGYQELLMCEIPHEEIIRFSDSFVESFYEGEDKITGRLIGFMSEFVYDENDEPLGFYDYVGYSNETYVQYCERVGKTVDPCDMIAV